MKEVDNIQNLIRHAKESKITFNNFVKWFVLSIISGVSVGVVISFFLKSLEYATTTRENHPWLLYLLPLGGAFVSFLYFKYGKDSAKGNNLIIEQINNSDGYIPSRMAPLVLFGTFITHLFGGSAGREGTGVQIGASISATLGRILKLKDIDYNILIISGVSSGFGVVFGTPIAGTVFGLEVHSVGKMRYEAIIPCLISSYIGTYISELFNIHHTNYHMANVGFDNIVFIKVIVCSILFGLTSKLFAELTHYLKRVFANKFPNTSLKSFVGGLVIIVAIIIIGNRQYLGLSLDLLNNAFQSPVFYGAFIIKLVLTAITLGSGFQGGEVTPLFVIGATLGNALSSIVNLPISFMAGVGMIGVFAGATRTPIASFIMGVELFGGIDIRYLFVACAISYVFSGRSTIYTAQRNELIED